MPICDTPLTKKIAWNGIALLVPETWYPAVALKNYLLFEDEYLPVFEIKWQQLTKDFSATSVLKRLTRMLPNTSIAPWVPPKAWLNVLTKYRTYGFTWKNDAGGGNGLLLYHRESQCVTLLRYHRFVAGPSSSEVSLLANLHIQDDPETRSWIIFDINASLPKEAVLQSHEFLTGKYSMVFTMEGCRITLLRFKPAAELLKNKTLSDFGKNLAGECSPVTCSCPETSHWAYSSSGFRRILDVARRKPTNINLLLTWFKKANTILGVRVQGNSSKTAQLLASITPNYLPLQQTITTWEKTDHDL